MAVRVFKERKALVLQWDAGEYDGPVTIRNESDDDVSETKLEANPGYAAVTFPLEYSGSFHATVQDITGKTIDEGDITVGDVPETPVEEEPVEEEPVEEEPVEEEAAE